MWYDGNLIRWYEGVLQAIGGWIPFTQNMGAPIRGEHAWRSGDESTAVFLTHEKIHTYRSAAGIVDVTPTANFTSGEVSSTSGASDGTPTLGSEDEATTWQVDNYGNDAMMVSTKDRQIWHLDFPYVEPALLANAPGCFGVVVTPEGFVVALATHYDGDTTLNQRLVRWSDVADPTIWQPSYRRRCQPGW